MAPDYGLSPEQLGDVYEAQIFPVLFAGVDEGVGEPTMVFVAGAPGAGKTVASVEISKRLVGVPLVLDGDDLRRFHPDYCQLVGSNPDLAVQVSAGDVDYWVDRLRVDAVGLRANVVVETTLRRPDLVLDMARDFKAQGYRVEVDVVATHPQVSAATTIARTEYEIQATGAGRVVPLAFHDQIVADLPGAVGELNRWPALVDSLRVTDRAGVAVWEGSNWASELVSREFNRDLYPNERRFLEEQIKWVRQRQTDRAAGPHERGPVDGVETRVTQARVRPDPGKLRGPTSTWRRTTLRNRQPPKPPGRAPASASIHPPSPK